MSAINPKQTSEQDRAVGARVAAMRSIRGLSQTTVANSLGVSFQQVQKYETGKNRIGAGRLHAIAELLGIPVSALFAEEGAVSTEDADTLSMTKIEGAASLMKAYASIESEQMRKDVLALVRSAAKLSAGIKAQA